MPADACTLHTDPWVPLSVLSVARHDESELIVRCPDSLYCLRRTLVTGGRIAPHFRNVAGLCPWIGVGVRPTAPPCGCLPFITTRQLRIVTHHGRTPWGPIASIACPGDCPEFAPIQAGRIGPHGPQPCSWAGIRVVEKGLYPPLLTAEDYQ
ncbi:hypothetical protein [Nocardia sp. CA-290969]|uniref:hypothetical protein n=1 Tax=Nocardia sp. CA-290969 TaxID=3239986 RepID=UPI003D8DE40E